MSKISAPLDEAKGRANVGLLQGTEAVVRGRAIRLDHCASAALAAMLTCACADQRSLPPIPPQYSLYAGMHGGPSNQNGWVGVVDCDTDSLVGSFSYPGMSAAYDEFSSPDGSYLATQEAKRETRVWDARYGTQLTTLPRGHISITFALEESLMLASGMDSTYLYKLPSFELDTVIPYRLWSATKFPNSSRVLAIKARGPTSVPPDLSLLVVFDIKSLMVLDSLVIDEDSSGSGFDVLSFDLSRQGRFLYAIGASNDLRRRFVGYDLASHLVLFRSELATATGSCRVSPDGREVWVTDPGSKGGIDPVWPGLILVYDALSGVVLDSISTAGHFETNPDRRLFVRDIRFVPGRDKAYVSTGRTNAEGFPVLIIDTRTRTIRDALFRSAPYVPGFIMVLPRP